MYYKFTLLEMSDTIASENTVTRQQEAIYRKIQNRVFLDRCFLQTFNNVYLQNILLEFLCPRK